MSLSHAAAGTAEPPTTRRGILRQLGPGLIIIGCLIKVFVQIEFGRNRRQAQRRIRERQSPSTTDRR